MSSRSTRSTASRKIHPSNGLHAAALGSIEQTPIGSLRPCSRNARTVVGTRKAHLPRTTIRTAASIEVMNRLYSHPSRNT